MEKLKKKINPNEFVCTVEYEEYSDYTLRFTKHDLINNQREIYEFPYLTSRETIIKMIKELGFKEFTFYISCECYNGDELVDEVHHINDIKEDEFDFFIDMENHDDACTEDERIEWDIHRGYYNYEEPEEESE